MTTNKKAKPESKKGNILKAVTISSGKKNRAQFEGMHYGTTASAHNWSNCK
jgi:hypothetical protein